MKNFLAFIVCFVSFNCQLNAQNSDLYKVYIKSGLVVKAELLKVIPDSMIQIRQYGLVSNIKMKDIDSIVFDESKLPNLNTNRMNVWAQRKQLLDSGWSYGFQPGFTLGADGWGITSSFTFRGSFLKNNLKHLMYGFNFGFDPYLLYEQAFGNISAESRFLFKEKSIRSPFIYSIAGYGFNLTSPALGRDGGVCASFGLGQSFRTRGDLVFSFMIGYKYQRFKEERFIWPTGNVLTYNNLNRMEFKTEWRF
ncbi:MAG: hypothetical protein IT245_03050 [Bacteroidia bacterium]|nr:hypothetical protein [Bacteroidia bacterium]